MTKEEIQEYLKRVEELELKLEGKDKDTLQWLIFGYNQCAKMLNEYECKVIKAVDYVCKMYEIEPANSREYDYHCEKLFEILGAKDGND